MTQQWTSEQVLNLAPDASSAKSGRGLAVVSKWPSLGVSERAAWGECQGSGKKPYQTRIDLSEPAFKCSCPSRKFPCKHAIGLFLLFAEQRKRFTAAAPPDWVTDWLDGRDQRAEKQEGRAATRRARESDPVAKAKREAQRATRIAEGLDRLEQWLVDLVHEGLAAAQTKPRAFWQDAGAAMVDAQCPGLARLVSAAESAATSGRGWERRLLDELGRLWLLVRAARVREQLPDGLHADVRSLLGLSQSKEEVLERGESLADDWHVVGQVTEADGRLTAQRTWLWSSAANRPALVLDFAAAGGRLDVSLVPGTAFEAELAFYPSACPERALVKTRSDVSRAALQASLGTPSIDEAMQRVRDAVAANPWRRREPIMLRDVRVTRTGAGGWSLVDSTDVALPMAQGFTGIWQLLGVSGGHPTTVFGEWGGSTLAPHAMWHAPHFVDFNAGRGTAG